MLKDVKIMFMVGIVLMCVHAGGGKSETSTNDFNFLCDVSDSLIGLWDTAEKFLVNVDARGEDELGKNIDEIFFGKKGYGSYKGITPLPEQFARYNHDRNKVCASSSGNDEMPSASESLASALLCLCTPIKGEEDDFCQLNVQDSGYWPTVRSHKTKEVFEKVWGDYTSAGVSFNCGKGYESETIQDAIEKLETNLTTLENALNKTGILGKDKNKCDGAHTCANVTKKPTWWEKIKRMEEIANQIQTFVKTQKEKMESKSKTVEQIESSEETTTSMSESKSQPIPTAQASPPSSTNHFEQHKQERRKAAEEGQRKQRISQPEPEQKIEHVPQKQEDPPIVPEPNETSASYLNSRRWLFLIPLLF